MQKTAKFSPKTRAIFGAIARQPLTVAEIAAVTGLPAKEIHPRIQNAVRSGYVTVAGQRALQGLRPARRYLAIETSEQPEPFKTSDGRFDFSELLRRMGPSAVGLPSGRARLVRNLEDEDFTEPA